jgi:hypothetical protein
MEPLVKHVALLSESRLVGTGEVMVVAAALQKQASRDLAGIWQIGATVDAFEHLEDVPVDYWPLIIRDDIGYSAAGIHLDQSGQPFALISADPDRDVWSLTSSHEMCEMLVDPFGNRVIAGDSIKPDQGRVTYLVEVCDPSEASNYAYSVNGVLVSDFYTPNFFDPVTAPGVRYSYTGAVKTPRSILPGGYISWRDLETDMWWQQTWFGGSEPQFRSLGKLTGGQSIRSQIDRITSEDTAMAVSTGRASAEFAGMPAPSAKSTLAARAQSLHSQINQLIAIQ